MKTPTCFLCLLVMLPVFTWCQNPGYMGRKTMVGYGMQVSPVTFGSTANNKTLWGNKNGSAETGHLRFNFIHDFFAERALSARWLLGTSLKYIHTGYDNRADLSNGKQGPTEYYTINAFTFTPYFKKYARRYMAPWGKYFMVGPTFSVMRSKHDAFMHILQTVNNHDTLITDFGSDTKKHYSADILIGSGRNRIFYNRISLDYGFNFQLLALLTAFESFDAIPPGGNPLQQEYISETIKSRVKGANRFNVFIKVGYLF